ncbi:MAG: nuclease A inhibitor family protein [Chloracidobacterium sp.]|nr:nuclease A inhibitor family protein [Chloracidobacterium sp.]
MQNYFHKNNKNDSELFRKIEQVCEGLTYISEADAPIQAFFGQPTDTVTGEIILQQAGLSPESVIEEKNFSDLFVRLATIKDWHGEAEIARAKKFLELKTLLEENLRDLKVFRIGKRRLDIFAVGIDQDGNLMGVTTTAVET